MRLLLMADGAVGLRIADWLSHEWKDDLAAIITTADNEITDLAKSRGVKTEVYSDSIVEQPRPDLGLLAWWPNIIREPLISFPEKGFINTHPSLLPYNRGKNYNFWALVEGAPFGVTLHKVDSGVDTGPIVAQKEVPTSWLDTGGTLYAKAAEAMVELVRESYPSLRNLDFGEAPQPTGAGSFHKAAELTQASRINLDQTYTGRDILNLLRARTFAPYPGCWFVDGDEEFEVRVAITRRAQG